MRRVKSYHPIPGGAHGVDEAEITEEKYLTKVPKDKPNAQALDLDSLDLTELIMQLEDSFGMKISDEQAAKIETVGQAVDFLLENQPPDAA